MNTLNRLLAFCMVFAISFPSLAQEQQFQTVITPAFTPVDWDRLLDARQEPENWLMYSGTLDSQ